MKLNDLLSYVDKAVWAECTKLNKRPDADLYQDARLKAWLYWRGHQDDMTNGQVSAIARGVVVDCIRDKDGRNGRKSQILYLTFDEMRKFECELERGNYHKDLMEEILPQLKEKDRTVLELAAKDGTDEIIKHYGCSFKDAQLWLRDAIMACRIILRTRYDLPL